MFRHYVIANTSYITSRIFPTWKKKKTKTATSPDLFLAVRLTNKFHQSQLSSGRRGNQSLSLLGSSSPISSLIHYLPIWMDPHPSRTPQLSPWIQFVIHPLHFIANEVEDKNMSNSDNKQIIVTNLTLATGKDEAPSVFFFFFCFFSSCQIWQSRHLSGGIAMLSNRCLIKELIWPLNKKWQAVLIDESWGSLISIDSC